MTEEQFDMEKKEAMKWLSDYSYDKGFYRACDTIDKGLEIMAPLQTITVEHARKLVSIVRKTQNEREAKLPTWVKDMLDKRL